MWSHSAVFVFFVLLCEPVVTVDRGGRRVLGALWMWWLCWESRPGFVLYVGLFCYKGSFSALVNDLLVHWCFEGEDTIFDIVLCKARRGVGGWFLGWGGGRGCTEDRLKVFCLSERSRNRKCVCVQWQSEHTAWKETLSVIIELKPFCKTERTTVTNTRTRPRGRALTLCVVTLYSSVSIIYSFIFMLIFPLFSQKNYIYQFKISHKIFSHVRW